MIAMLLCGEYKAEEVCDSGDLIYCAVFESVCDLRRMFGLIMDFIDTGLNVFLGNRPKESVFMFLDKAPLLQYRNIGHLHRF